MKKHDVTDTDTTTAEVVNNEPQISFSDITETIK